MLFSGDWPLFCPSECPGLADTYGEEFDELFIKYENEKRFKRVVKAAEGAALGTDTQVSFEIIHGNYSLMPNDTLQRIMYKELSDLGGISYTEEEKDYAKKLYSTLLDPKSKIGDQKNIAPYKPRHGYGSTDVGDISWLVPTAGARIATWVPGTPAHSWQAVAAGGGTEPSLMMNWRPPSVTGVGVPFETDSRPHIFLNWFELQFSTPTPPPIYF